MKQLGQVLVFREARHLLSEATGGRILQVMLSRFENGQSELWLRNFFSALSALSTQKQATVAAGIQDHHSQRNS